MSHVKSNDVKILSGIFLVPVNCYSVQYNSVLHCLQNENSMLSALQPYSSATTSKTNALTVHRFDRIVLEVLHSIQMNRIKHRRMTLRLNKTNVCCYSVVVWRAFLGIRVRFTLYTLYTACLLTVVAFGRHTASMYVYQQMKIRVYNKYCMSIATLLHCGCSFVGMECILTTRVNCCF